MKHGSPVNLACAPLPPSSCNAQVTAFSHFLSIYFLSNVFYLSFFKTQLFFMPFFRIIFLYLGARVETGSCRAHSLTLSMPLSPPHKEYYLLCMHAAGSWRLEGPGRSERAPEAVRTPAWPTSHYHHIFLGVRARRAGDLFSLPRFSLLSRRPPSD